MSRTHTKPFVRDDRETEIEVEYEVPYHGHPGNGWDDDGEGPEIEVVKAWLILRQTDGKYVDGDEIELTDTERDRITVEIAENPDWWADEGPDPDDWRDRMIDDRLTGDDS